MKIEYTKLSGDKPVLILYRDNNHDVTDTCPFCNTNHMHGTGDGHRVAHCETDSKEFVIADDGTELFQKNGYVIRSRH